MTTSSKPLSQPLPNTGGVDQEGLYGVWHRWNEKRLEDQTRLHNKASYKALNIPEDNMGDISSRTTVNGIGTGGLLAVAAMAAVPGLAAAAMLWSQLDKQPATPTTQPQAQTQTTATSTTHTEDLVIRHWVLNEDGEYEQIILPQKGGE